MTSSIAPPRSGCAVISGVVLIAVGSVFLAHNVLSLMGVSPLSVGIQALAWYGAYWPLLFIAWGAYKILTRFRHPERSYVGAAEIVVLVWILTLGLVIRGAERLAEELAMDVSFEDLASIIGPDLLGPPHRSVEDAAFELADATVLAVDIDHGQLVIVGSEDRRLRVNMTKQIHSFSDADADEAFSEVNLEFSSSGERAGLRVSRGDSSGRVRTDLEIRVPKSVSVRVSNRRGDVRLEGLAAPTHVETAHGNVEATNLSSGLDVETSHATIRLDRISGAVVAKNRHGAVYVIDVDGDLTATTEHSSVSAEHVSGDVVLRTEHGSVRATDIAGELQIGSPYSEVSVERSGRGVSIASSHRPVFVHSVGGRLELVAPSARILVRGVAGDVSIESGRRPVSVADVGGSVSVISEQSEIEIESAEGAVTVHGSHEDIRVSGLNARLSILTSHADVDVAAHRITGAIEVETSYGNVSLALPVGAAVGVVATTRDGSLLSEFPELASAAEGSDRNDGKRRWEGTLGAGTHPVTLETSYGDITLTELPE